MLRSAVVGHGLVADSSATAVVLRPGQCHSCCGVVGGREDSRLSLACVMVMCGRVSRALEDSCALVRIAPGQRLSTVHRQHYWLFDSDSSRKRLSFSWLLIDS